MRLLDFFRRTPMPWRGRTPIAEFLRTWDRKADLPDEDPGEKIRWAAGAQDGVFSHHGGGEPDVERAKRIAREVMRAAARGDDVARARLYALVIDEPVQSLLDAVGDELVAQKADARAVAALGRWLATNAAHREPAKLGLSLLGLDGGTDGDLELLRLFARHDEFTKFAAVVAASLVPDPIDEWLEMAKHVDGWGKIALVERIVVEDGGERAYVRDWLLRHACRNSVMDEYLAYGCAMEGRLHEALAAESIDEELLRGASQIVTALLREDSPGGNINDYEHAEEDIAALLRHLAAHPSFARQATAGDILEWIERAEERAPAFRDAVRERCRAILSTLTHAELRQRLLSGDRVENWRAWKLAPLVGVDLWDDAFTLLEREPLEQSHYYRLLTTDDPLRVRRVVAFAEEHLPLDAIATGPAEELGFGQKFAAHGCLGQVLFRMKQGDVFSPRLVLAALRSPVVRNRGGAAAAIEARLPRGVPPEVLDAVRAAEAVEPNEKTRELMRKVVSTSS
jgi:hypothetical protein